jgi:hypothetical protein
MSPRASLSGALPTPVATSVAASAFLLTAAAVLAGALGAWRFAADPGWANGFFIAEGWFSHYQSWFAVAIGAQMSALVLKRWVAQQT